VQRLELAQHPLERLRVLDLAGVDHPLVTLAPGPDLLDVGVRALLLRGEVVDLDPQVAYGVLHGRTPPRELSQLLGLRDRAQLVGEDVDPGVELLDVEQPELDERVGFQSSLLMVGAMCGPVLRPGRSTGPCWWC
jgi:hypothetical protein